MGVMRCAVLGSVLASAALQTSCTSAPTATAILVHDGEYLVLDATSEVSRIVLPEAVGHYSGIAFDPSGRLLALHQSGRVIDVQNNAQVWRSETTPTRYGFTDLVAIREDALALTAMSDGYLLDLTSGLLWQHFCYEPGWMSGAPGNPVQISRALALAPSESRLYAQPVTMEQQGAGPVTASYIAAYDLEGGVDLTWWQFPERSFIAGGLAVLPGEGPTQLLLGNQNFLFRFDTEAGVLTTLANTQSVSIIGGLAIDPSRRSVHVLDDQNGNIVELALSSIGVE